MSQKIITTKEEVYNLNINGSHYKPYKYIENYLFSKEILLDVFCCEDLVYCYEDYYYDDIDINMIKNHQPHIDINEFINLWNDLDEIRTAELYSKFILENPKAGLYFYELIRPYSQKLDYNELCDNFNVMLKKNKFIKKYNLNNLDGTIIEKSTEILKAIPEKYSSILPL